MELPFVEYDEAEYLETDTGNKVSQQAIILGSHNIILAGKTIIQRDYVHVGENTIVEAASIGNNVYIGRNCVIGRFAIIKDCVVIKDNTIVGPNTVIPSFSLVSGGPPSQNIDTLSENTMEQLEARAKNYYMKFTPK